MTEVRLQQEVVTDYQVEGDTGRMFVIERTRLKDAAGNIVSEQVHRRPIEPDADVSGESAEVRALAQTVRTPTRIQEYERVRDRTEADVRPPRTA